MQFVKNGEVYKVTRITGAQDNLLGIALADEQGEIELIAFEAPGARKVRAPADEVLKQVSEGLSEINLELGRNYCLSKIFYFHHESAANSVYRLLTCELIRKIDEGLIV